jgi:hypothetical protein
MLIPVEGRVAGNVSALLFELGSFARLYFQTAPGKCLWCCRGPRVAADMGISYSGLILFYGAEFVKILA